MDEKVYVLFPIDLYNDISNLKHAKVFLVEETIYFNRSSKKLGSLKFNILKPVYHYTRNVHCHRQQLKCSFLYPHNTISNG